MSRQIPIHDWIQHVLKLRIGYLLLPSTQPWQPLATRAPTSSEKAEPRRPRLEQSRPNPPPPPPPHTHTHTYPAPHLVGDGRATPAASGAEVTRVPRPHLVGEGRAAPPLPGRSSPVSPLTRQRRSCTPSLTSREGCASARLACPVLLRTVGTLRPDRFLTLFCSSFFLFARGEV
uniref:Uncharacterized protein n=1 Tax=Setaria viridis TaxID=4556 RepID=A0A4U6V6J0_SETVI|nr:hypothetical protein SEVIR_4G236701v2 [Setaria viridis]